MPGAIDPRTCVRSFDDIAKAMGLTLNQVQQIYYTAIKKLRKQPDALRVMQELARELHPEPYRVELT